LQLKSVAQSDEAVQLMDKQEPLIYVKNYITDSLPADASATYLS